MTDIFRGVVKSIKDAGKGFRLVTAIGRCGVDVDAAQLWQQRGFASYPKAGDPVVFLKRGGLVLAIGTASEACPAIEEGETIVYATSTAYIRMKADGSIVIKAPEGMIIDGSLEVTETVRSATIQDAVGTLDALRQAYMVHIHPVSGAVTSGPTPPPPPTPEPSV